MQICPGGVIMKNMSKPWAVKMRETKVLQVKAAYYVVF
jgi:hypothetical protein